MIHFWVKTWKYQTCNNRKKKKLFGVRSKLSYNKFLSENLLVIEMKKKKILRIKQNSNV